MFSTTISMWLGIAFLVLAILAVLLQAILWGPRHWDEVTKKTKAPRAWLRVHAAVGYTYGLIYLYMMWHMVPRMWMYQYELPARTVVHAVVAILIGVLLISKICVIRFFRHFEEAMPRFGFGIMTCTVVLVFLSVPYALRAHDVEGRLMDADNLARVDRLLGELELGDEVDRAALTTEEGFSRGQTILVTKCTACHDMRTILVKPRTAHGWHDVNLRMLEKPAVFGERLSEEDVPFVTAYLIAITPDIQESMKRRRSEESAEHERAEAVGEAMHEGDDFDAPTLDATAAKALYVDKCTQCHELDEVDKHGGDDLAGWRSVVAAMVEEGAEIDDTQSVQIARYLAETMGKSSTAAATKPEKPEKPAKPAKPEKAAEKTEPVEKPEKKPVEKPEKKPQKKPAEKVETKPEEAATEAGTDAAPEESAEAPAPKPKVDKAAGGALFQAKCKSCHGADGKGDTPYGEKIGAPNLVTTGSSKAKMENTIRGGIPGTKMKGYEDKLSDAQIENVLAWITSL